MDLSLLEENKMYAYGVAGVVGSVSALLLLRSYMRGPKCTSKTRLDGKVVVITGANTGIGKETAIDMARRGATVIAACRSELKGLKAVTEVREITKNPKIFFMALDLSSLQSVRDFADSFLKQYKRLDILINNAGVMMCPYSKTKDGFEMQFGTNHLGHFALTNLLLGRLKESAPSRIVNVSSSAHQLFCKGINFDDLQSEKGYSSTTAYGQSKLANVLLTKELDRKMKSTGVTSYTLHPGAVDTELQRHSKSFYLLMRLTFGFLTKTPEYGAQTNIYCAVQEGIEKDSGMYFSDCRKKKSSEPSCDPGTAKKLWEVSEELTGVKFPF